MRTLAVYGTLKRNQGNNRMMGEDTFVGTATVIGVMTNTAGYPYLFEQGTVEGGKHDREYEVEIHRVKDLAASNIDRMELGAGYYIGTIETNHGAANIYYMRPSQFVQDDIISSYPVSN